MIESIISKSLGNSTEWNKIHSLGRGFAEAYIDNES
jgi:hypothetical protein